MPVRIDKVTAPDITAELLLARRGQAYFSRQLNGLTDDELDGPSLRPEWSRRRVIAHVGLQARAFALAVQAVNNAMVSEPDGTPAFDVDFSASLPPQALRNLSYHAAIHLNVEWRDLDANFWPLVRSTVWVRTRELWIRALDLNSTARFSDLPPEVTDRMLGEIVEEWRARRSTEDIGPFALYPTDCANVWKLDPTSKTELALHGSSVELLRWATNRGPFPGFSRGGIRVAAPPAAAALSL